MAGNAWKRVLLPGLQHPANPSIEPLRGQRPMMSQPWHNVGRAQDTVLGGARRVLAALNLRGQADVGVPSGTQADGSSQTHPNLEDWTTVTRHWVRLTPGTQPALRCVYFPSAGTATPALEGFTDGGTGGRLRCRLTWHKGANSSGPHEWVIDLEGEKHQIAGPGSAIHGLKRRSLPLMVPPELVTPAEQSKYSEWAELELELAVAGGARVIDACVYERPMWHVQEHDRTELQSAHAYWLGGAAPTKVQTARPQTKGKDGTYEEPRFGTHQMLEVAQRQGERLGPRAASSTWHPLDHDFLEEEHPSLIVTSAFLQDIFDDNIMSWSPDNPGIMIDGAYAQLHGHNDEGQIMRRRRAVVPVRVTVDAVWDAGTGELGGVVRVQSSATEWIELRWTDDGVRETKTAVGLLECQVVGDQVDVGLVQVLASAADGTRIGLYGTPDIEFGQWPKEAP